MITMSAFWHHCRSKYMEISKTSVDCMETDEMTGVRSSADYRSSLFWLLRYLKPFLFLSDPFRDHCKHIAGDGIPAFGRLVP
jgi:hypothetical protein